MAIFRREPYRSQKPFSSYTPDEKVAHVRDNGRAPLDPDRFNGAYEEMKYHESDRPQEELDRYDNAHDKFREHNPDGKEDPEKYRDPNYRHPASYDSNEPASYRQKGERQHGADPNPDPANRRYPDKMDDKTGKFSDAINKYSSSPGASTAMSGGMTKVMGKKNRTGIKVAIVSAVLLLGFAAFFLTLPLKIIHYATVMFNHNNRTNDHTDSKAERKLMHRLSVLQLDDETGHKSKTGNWIRDKLTNMRMDKFNKLLSSQQLKMEFDAKNRFVGVRDEKTGELKTKDFREMSFWEQRNSMADIVRDQLAPHRYLQHVLYTKAMRTHAGISFKFWSKDRATDITKSLKDKLLSKVRRGLAGDAALEQPKIPDGQEPTDPKEKAAYDAAKAQAAQAGEVAQAEYNAFDKTKSMIEAHKAGIQAFRAKAALANGFTGIGMIYCMLKEMIDTAERTGALNLIIYLMREGNMLVTMSHQLISGENMNFDEVGAMATRLDGDANYDPAQDENGKDFTQSCAWKTATDDGPCSTYLDRSKDHKGFDHYNPGLSEAANPDHSVFSGFIGVIAGFFNIPGSGPVCAVLNSWFGWVIMGAELAAAILDGETSTAAASAAKGLLVGVVLNVLVPKLLDAATGLAVTGLENAVGLTNNGDAGLNLSSKDWSRVMGGRVGKHSEQVKIAEAAHEDEVAYAKSKGWSYRTFALDNDKSLVNRVVENTPSTPAGMVAAIRSTFLSLPSNFAALFFRPKVAFAADTSDMDMYGFRDYMTTDVEIDKYEPDEVLDYLQQPLPGTDKTRLSMLGDVKDYTPADHSFDDGGDTDTSNLRHCFLGKIRTTHDEEDPICLDLGVLTGDGNKDPKNPGPEQILNLIYCKANGVCNLPWGDDFLKYRLYIHYAFMTRALGGLEDDTDPFAATNQAIADVYGICAVPAAGSDPGAQAPPDDYTKVNVSGVTLNARTLQMLRNAEGYATHLGYNKPGFDLTQGSYTSATTASAGTHDGGGALDISVLGMTTDQRTLVVKALRMAGFAAWNRYPPDFPNHIHAIAIGDKEMSSAARDQVTSYFQHKDGLAGNLGDGDQSSGYPYPDWAGRLCQGYLTPATPAPRPLGR
jgi:hypothetical protein